MDESRGLRRKVKGCEMPDSPLCAADDRLVAAHEDAHDLAGHQQHQGQIPLLLEAQGRIGGQIADQPADDRGDDQRDGKVGKADGRQRAHDLGAQLQRLAQPRAAGIDELLAGQPRQQARVGHPGGVGADRDKERLAKVGNAGQPIFQIETQRDHGRNAEKGQQGDDGGRQVDVHGMGIGDRGLGIGD